MKRLSRSPFDAYAQRQRVAAPALDLRSDDAVIAFWATRPEDLPIKSFVILLALSEWLARTGRDYADGDEMVTLWLEFEPIVVRLVRLGLERRLESWNEMPTMPEASASIAWSDRTQSSTDGFVQSLRRAGCRSS